ncbi:MAG: hypothetical protein ACMXX7_00370 [Candidatus Woesearchaeota archaeon]
MIENILKELEEYTIQSANITSKLYGLNLEFDRFDDVLEQYNSKKIIKEEKTFRNYFRLANRLDEGTRKTLNEHLTKVKNKQKDSIDLIIQKETGLLQSITYIKEALYNV